MWLFGRRFNFKKEYPKTLDRWEKAEIWELIEVIQGLQGILSNKFYDEAKRKEKDLCELLDEHDVIVVPTRKQGEQEIAIFVLGRIPMGYSKKYPILYPWQLKDFFHSDTS